MNYLVPSMSGLVPAVARFSCPLSLAPLALAGLVALSTPALQAEGAKS